VQSVLRMVQRTSSDDESMPDPGDRSRIMRRRLIVHVGFPKTGTSTIQRAFDNERQHVRSLAGEPRSTR